MKKLVRLFGTMLVGLSIVMMSTGVMAGTGEGRITDFTAPAEEDETSRGW